MPRRTSTRTARASRAAATAADLTRDQRRLNRGHVLDALNSETGADAGSSAQDRVRAYRADPVGASTTEFGFVGGLALRRWYVAADKPNTSERRSLWFEVMKRLGKTGTADPGGWDGSSDVLTLQAIAEEA